MNWKLKSFLVCLHQKLRPHRWFAEPSTARDSSTLKMRKIYHVFMKSIVSSHQMLWSVKIGYKQLLMGKIIKQAIFFFTRISLPAVSSTTGARFLPNHHVQQEAGFRDRTSRRCCKLCRQSKHLHTYQWEKKRILLPAVLSQLAHVSALSLSATWGGGRVQWQNQLNKVQERKFCRQCK